VFPAEQVGHLFALAMPKAGCAGAAWHKHELETQLLLLQVLANGAFQDAAKLGEGQTELVLTNINRDDKA
jgi:hypothetical protein